MSTRRGIVEVECPGSDCGEVFETIVELRQDLASVDRVQCPGCGRDLDLRVELDLEVEVRSERRLPQGAVRETAEGDISQQGDTVHKGRGAI